MDEVLVREALAIALGLAENAALRAANPTLAGDHGAATIRRALASLASDTLPAPIPYQARVEAWVRECFGPAVATDPVERNHRFLEESLELVQACGATAVEAHHLVDYVFGRAAGDKAQELGGVMVTLAGLCAAHGLDMQTCGDAELAAIWPKTAAIRAKWAAKPSFRPV